MKSEYSAGGIVYDQQSDGLKILVIQNSKINHPNVKHWGFPKGHLEPGETADQAALREVAEETAVTAIIESKIGDSKYVFTREGQRIFKRVSIFLMKYQSGELQKQVEEISEVRWVTPEEAMSQLTFSNDKKLLKQALKLLNHD